LSGSRPPLAILTYTSPACVSMPSSGREFSLSMRILTCASSLGSLTQFTVRLAAGSGPLPRLEPELGRGGCEIARCSSPLPNDVLASAPVPGDFLLQLLAKRPDLDVVAGTVQPVEHLLAALLNLQAELRLEPIARFVANQRKVLAGLGHIDFEARVGRIALF